MLFMVVFFLAICVWHTRFLFSLLFSMIPHPCSDNAVCAKVPRLRFSGWDCHPKKRLFLLPSHFDSDSASTPSLGRRRSDARNPWAGDNAAALSPMAGSSWASRSVMLLFGLI